MRNYTEFIVFILLDKISMSQICILYFKFISSILKHDKYLQYRNILFLNGFEKLYFHIPFIKSINMGYGVY